MTRIRSKQTKNAPGDYFPEPMGKRVWWLSLWIFCLPLGTVLGVVLARALSSGIKADIIGAAAGLAISLIFCLRYQTRFARYNARRHYQRIANSNPEDADACVQAGLWVHKKTDKKEDFERGDNCYRVALQRVPGHRDAIISLALSLSAPSKARPPRHKDVVELLEPWLAEHDDLFGEAILAKALHALGEYKRAAVHYRRVLKLFPDTPSRSEIEAYLGSHTRQGEKDTQLEEPI